MRKLFLVLMLVLLSVPGWAGNSFVAAPATTTCSAATSCALSAYSCTTGNIVHVGTTAYYGTNNTLGISCSGAGCPASWHTINAATNYAYDWWGVCAGGSMTVTLTDSNSNTHVAAIAEYSTGSSPTADGTPGYAYSYGPSQTVSMTTTNAGDLCIGVGDNNWHDATSTSSTGWNQRVSADVNLYDNLNAGSGSVAYTISDGHGSTSRAATIACISSTGGGAPAPTCTISLLGVGPC